ncbi:MAG: hypothetical protein ALECFALPRED_000335, partial [Alectoria fallacina]
FTGMLASKFVHYKPSATSSETLRSQDERAPKRNYNCRRCTVIQGLHRSITDV